MPMSQLEIMAILDHPMTAKQIAVKANLPLQCAKGNLTRMRKNRLVVVNGKIHRDFLWEKI